jgi:hypothetical protein
MSEGVAIPSRRLVAATLLAGALLVTPSVASADDEDAIIGVTVVGSLAVLDVVFTVYSGLKVDAREEPERGWMIAQSVIMGLQTVAVDAVGTVMSVAEEDEGIELAVLPFATWLGGMSAFSMWSLAAPQSVDVPGRFGLSTVLGLNVYFTSVAAATLGSGRASPDYMSIPQLALMAPECLLTTIKAATDPDARGAWIGLAAWSGLLSVHATVSLIARGIEFERKASGDVSVLPFAPAPEGIAPGVSIGMPL